MEKKREILEEQIKQALTSTYKVISDKFIDSNPGNKTFDIKSLDFSEKSLGVEDAIIVAECLKVNASLKKINLYGNNIGDEGREALRSVKRDGLTIELKKMISIDDYK